MDGKRKAERKFDQQAIIAYALGAGGWYLFMAYPGTSTPSIRSIIADLDVTARVSLSVGAIFLA